MAGSLLGWVIVISLTVFTSAERVVFHQSLYNFSLVENVPIGFMIAQVQAFGLDNQTLSYQLIGGDDFTVKTHTGQILTNRVLDYERSSRYTLLVFASDQASGTATATVYVNVIDVNDNAPQFHQMVYDVTLAQSTPMGTAVITVIANDADSGPGGEIEYSLLGDNRYFAINPFTGVIVKHSAVLLPLGTVNLAVRATDHGLPPMWATAEARINIVPSTVQVHGPTTNVTIPTTFYDVIVRENTAPGTGILNIVNVLQTNHTGTVSHSLTGDDGRFSFTPGGRLRVTGHLDYESKRFYDLTLSVLQTLPSEQSTVLDLVNIKVTISDVNDYPPMFVGILSPFRVASTFPVGKMIYKFLAWDGDSPVDGNNMVYYTLETNNTSMFTLDEGTGVLKTTASLAEGATFRLRVKAMDHGSPPLHGYTDIEIRVFDPSQHYPVFDASFIPVTLSEGSPVGTTFAVVHATLVAGGPSSSTTVAYSIIGTSAQQEFSINAVTGDVITRKVFDRESQERTALVVQATSVLDNTRNTDMIINVEIADVNDNPPVFPFRCYMAFIPSNAARGRILFRLQAYDVDISSQLTYTVTDGNQAGLFSVSRTGEVSVEKSITNIPAQYNLTVSVSDGRFSASSQLLLTNER